MVMKMMMHAGRTSSTCCSSSSSNSCTRVEAGATPKACLEPAARMGAGHRPWQRPHLLLPLCDRCEALPPAFQLRPAHIDCICLLTLCIFVPCAAWEPEGVACTLRRHLHAG